MDVTITSGTQRNIMHVFKHVQDISGMQVYRSMRPLNTGKPGIPANFACSCPGWLSKLVQKQTHVGLGRLTHRLNMFSFGIHMSQTTPWLASDLEPEERTVLLA